MKALRILAWVSLALSLGCGPSAESVVTGIQSENPAVREDMVEFARRFDEPMVVDALIKALDDPSTAIRVKAVESLAELGHAAAAAKLVELLNNDESVEVRTEAIEALGRIQDPAAVAPLLILLETCQPNDAPLNVLWALGNIGDKRALPLLSRLRDEASDPYVVYNANVALRKIR